MNKTSLSDKVARYLTKHHDLKPVMRLIHISGKLGMNGKELMGTLLDTILIHVDSSAGGLDALVGAGAGMDGIMAEVAPYLKSLNKDGEIENVRQALGRDGFEALLTDGGNAAMLPTNFGGAIIHARGVSALAAIEDWNLPTEKEDRSWREEDEVFVIIRDKVLARLRSDRIFAPLPDEELRDLAWQLAERIDRVEHLEPKTDLFEIAGWLDAAKNDSELEFGEYLKRIKSLNLEKEVIWARGRYLKAEKAFAHPAWPKIEKALIKREERDPIGGNGWIEEDLLWDALARICWDIFSKYSSICPEWPEASVLARVVNDRKSCRVNFSGLGPKAIRSLRGRGFLSNQKILEHGRFDISMVAWPLMNRDIPLEERPKIWWDCLTGEVVPENGDAALAEDIMAKLKAMH